MTHLERADMVLQGLLRDRAFVPQREYAAAMLDAGINYSIPPLGTLIDNGFYVVQWSYETDQAVIMPIFGTPK